MLECLLPDGNDPVLAGSLDMDALVALRRAGYDRNGLIKLVRQSEKGQTTTRTPRMPTVDRAEPRPR